MMERKNKPVGVKIISIVLALSAVLVIIGNFIGFGQKSLLMAPDSRKIELMQKFHYKERLNIITIADFDNYTKKYMVLTDSNPL